MIMLVWSFLTFLNALLSLRMMGKHTEIGIFNPVEIQLLLHFKGLVASLCIMAVGGKAQK